MKIFKSSKIDQLQFFILSKNSKFQTSSWDELWFLIISKKILRFFSCWFEPNFDKFVIISHKCVFTRKEKFHDVHRIPIKFKEKFNWRQSFTSYWVLAKTSKIVQTKSCSTWQNTRFNFLDFGTLNFSEVNTSSYFLSISLTIVVFCYPFATILRESNC